MAKDWHNIWCSFEFIYLRAELVKYGKIPILCDHIYLSLKIRVG